MSKVKMVFNRIWMTFVIVVNTAYGILLTCLSFAMLTDRYMAQDWWVSAVAATMGIVVVNILNFVTRKYLMNY